MNDRIRIYEPPEESRMTASEVARRQRHRTAFNLLLPVPNCDGWTFSNEQDVWRRGESIVPSTSDIGRVLSIAWELHCQLEAETAERQIRESFTRLAPDRKQAVLAQLRDL